MSLRGDYQPSAGLLPPPALPCVSFRSLFEDGGTLALDEAVVTNTLGHLAEPYGSRTGSVHVFCDIGAVSSEHFLSQERRGHE